MKQIETKKLVMCAALVAISLVFSKIKLFELPLGGSVTLFSMLIITLAGYFCGLKYGLISCIVYALLKTIFGGNIYYPLQVFFDYGLSYVVFFISGFSIFRKNINKLTIAFMIACVFRWIFASISGYVFFREYTPENINPILYVLEYNGAYIFAEMILSIILINIKFIKNNIDKLKNLINN